MRLEKVKKIGERFYVEYTVKSGKEEGNIKKQYGQIHNCKVCGCSFFVSDYEISKGHGNFCSGRCSSSLENNARWAGGRKKDVDGYVFIKMPQHPFADNHGYVKEHRIIIEKIIGRYLLRTEIIHHVNKIKDDNCPKNLMAFVSHQSHNQFENNKILNQNDIIFDGRKV